MSSPLMASGATLAIIGLIGAYLDVRYRRLPNWLCLLALPLGLGFTLATLGFDAAGLALLHALAALVIGAGLFALGGIGGGDAKFYAGLAAWFPITAGLLLFVFVALTGLLLLLAWLPLRGRLRPDAPVDSEFRKVPYGVAIAGGAVAAFALFNGVL